MLPPGDTPVVIAAPVDTAIPVETTAPVVPGFALDVVLRNPEVKETNSYQYN